jgi:hypothetical protein
MTPIPQSSVNSPIGWGLASVNGIVRCVTSRMGFSLSDVNGENVVPISAFHSSRFTATMHLVTPLMRQAAVTRVYCFDGLRILR